MGWWTTRPGGTTVNLDDGYDETQGKMGDTAWDGLAATATIVSILKKLAAGGGTGGGPATIADGADVTQGAQADVAWVSGDGTVISLLKKIASAGGSAVSIADGADAAQGTTTDTAAALTVVGLLKAIKAAVQATLTTTTSWTVPQHVIVDTAPSTAVTGPLTDTQLRAAPVPVSGTVTASGPLTDTQLRASVVPISDGAGSLTVDAPVGTPVWVRLSDGAAAFVGQKSMAASVPVVLASDQASIPVASTLAAETTKVIGTVNPPALTKGTLSANGFSVQDAKDSGRNVTNYFMAAQVALTNAEVMQSLTGYKSGAAVGATATPVVVSAGKIYRIERVIISFLAASAIGGALVRLRALSSGVALVTSPLVMNWHVGVPAIFTAGAEMTYTFDYPDGLEFAAGFGIAIGALGEGADGVTATAVGKILVSIEGYEY